ncbi:MAG: sodium:solute symporter [Burkholderiales bacterium]|nr:sodium:solute symporter [Opitutaceae bacterium]
MNLGLLDWLIVAALIITVGAVAFVTRRYMRGVADFLAGNRCAGRYLLTLSEGMASMGLVGIIANFEKFYHAGFAASWWGNMLAPVGLIIALSGWVSYRYRQTRALTMAQFFEMRYSRRFRVAAGITAWISGVLNYGVFPGIVARALIYFCGFPTTFNAFGCEISTMLPVMTVMLGMTLLLTLNGGMVTVMITDFLQGQFINVVFLVLAGVMLTRFSWGEIVHTLEAAPAKQSLLNPFDQAGLSDFNGWFFAIFAFKLFYNKLGWQGTQGYNSAAKSPHEARMAGILAEWRGGVSYLMMMIMPICAYVMLHNANYAVEAAAIQSTLQGIPDAQIQTQLTVPIALIHMLPAGMLGLLAAAMIAGTIGNDTTYLHAWGSIFVQDVLLPFKKEPLTPKQHLLWLRLSIVGVAAFSFAFSLLFPLRDYLLMYFLITGAIYLSGSGAIIIGGLYWKKGTTAGAWSALFTGAGLSLIGALLRAIWPAVPALVELAPQFPLNGAWMALIASLSALTVYIVVSLLTCRADFDLNKLLHRDAVAPAAAETSPAVAMRGYERWLGINREFTRGDRFIYFAKIGWAGFWFLVFVVISVIALIWGVPASFWPKWWLFTLVLGLVVGAATVVWFLWGGTKDLFDLMRTLRTTERDATDDGTVHEAPPH